MTGRRALVALALLAAAPCAALARDVPRPTYPLRDDVGLLDASTKAAVERECVALERETASELGVLITDTTAGEDPNAFAHRVLNAWGVGKRGRGNGVLLLFAMRDRRIELAPGHEYEALFTDATCKRVLGLAVPHMRSGRPQEGVLAVVREVAERMRTRRIAADLIESGVERVDFGGGGYDAPASSPGSTTPPVQQRSKTGTSLSSTGPTRFAPTSTSRFTASSGSSRLGQNLVRFVVLVVLVGWAVALIYALTTAFSTGQLVIGSGSIVALALLVPIAAAGFLLVTTKGGVNGLEPPDFVLGGGGLLVGVVCAVLTSHMCPRCNKWMSISHRTLTSATYHSSGTGQKTSHCIHCGYHRVETYTIPRRTRSRSRSSYSSSSRSSFGGSSRSSGGGSRSFGGGSSRGGGGGVSW